MPKFDLKSHAPAKTAVYTFPTSPPLGRLHVRYAGQANRKYTDGLAKLTAKTGAARRLARGQVTAELLRENLNIDRRLFPRFVIDGWDGGLAEEGEKLPSGVIARGGEILPFLDSDGEEVPYSLPACEEFLKALPDWLMQDLSQFCGNPVNFTPDDDITADDLDFEDTAGN